MHITHVHTAYTHVYTTHTTYMHIRTHTHTVREPSTQRAEDSGQVVRLDPGVGSVGALARGLGRAGAVIWLYPG